MPANGTINTISSGLLSIGFALCFHCFRMNIQVATMHRVECVLCDFVEQLIWAAFQLLRRKVVSLLHVLTVWSPFLCNFPLWKEKISLLFNCSLHCASWNHLPLFHGIDDKIFLLLFCLLLRFRRILQCGFAQFRVSICFRNMLRDNDWWVNKYCDAIFLPERYLCSWS